MMRTTGYRVSPSVASDYSLRTATEPDLDALFAIARESLTYDRFSRDLLAEKLFDARRPDEFHWAVHLAEYAGRCVGFMQSISRPSQHLAWIGIFAITPQ